MKGSDFNQSLKIEHLRFVLEELALFLVTTTLKSVLRMERDLSALEEVWVNGTPFILPVFMNEFRKKKKNVAS